VEVRYSRSASKALLRSHKRELIREKILWLATTFPDLGSNAIRLKGRSDFRLRVQDWRVIFRVEDGVLWVDDIGPRGAIYGD